jgi:cell division transport system permease protein
MSDALSTGSAPIRRNMPRFGAADRLVPHSQLAGPMPWVIAIMIALTVIAVGTGLALRNLGANAGTEIAGGLTVQILEGAPAERERQAQAAVAQLRTREDVAQIRRVPEDELNALLEPWLGKEALTGDEAIPVPALIDVQLRGPVTDRRLAELRASLTASVPAARIDAQAGWLGPVFDALASLQWLALGLVVLLAGTSAAAVWLAARSALGSNRETIEVIHLLGATDGQIARLFERSIGLDAGIGGLAGLALGAGALWLLGGQFARLGSSMVAGGGLGPLDWALLAAVPLAGVVLAMFTARLTVLGSLRRML